MIICPQCHAQLHDDAKFCNSCGTKIEDTIFCPNCGVKTSSDSELCQNCGASLIENDFSEVKSLENEKKKLPKKNNLYVLIGILLIAVIVFLIVLFGGKNSSEPLSYGLYVKNQEIFFTDFSVDEPLQITSNFLNGGDEDLLYDLMGGLDWYCTFSSDGKTLFYPGKIEDHFGLDFYYALWYRNLEKPDEEPGIIDRNISSYVLNDADTIITYLKGEEGILCQYNIANQEKEEIDVGAYNFKVSSDGKKIVYYNNEGILCLKTDGKDKEEIGQGDEQIFYVTKDFTSVFFIEEGTLYKKTDGKEKEMISSDVSRVMEFYDTGEFYYTKVNAQDISLMDYVQDDMQYMDSEVTVPEEPEYPSSSDYDTDEEYEAARDTYEKAYDTYEAKMSKYIDKAERDALREQLSSETMEGYNYTLCYFDGTEGKDVINGFVYEKESPYREITYTFAEKTPMAAFEAYHQDTVEHLCMSEIDNIEDVWSTLGNGLAKYISIKGTATLIEQNSASDFEFSDDGNSIYYLDYISDDTQHGDLYRMSVSDGKLQEPELYDTDVYSDNSESSFLADSKFITGDQFMYFKNCQNREGDLYINKAEIDYDVNLYYANYYDAVEKLFYYTDMNASGGYATLKYLENDEIIKVDDDITDYVVLPNGGVLYLYDYSKKYNYGDLYLYKDGETKKIDSDVYGLIWKERSELFNY